MTNDNDTETVGVYQCDDCGDSVREPKASEKWDCVICGGRMKEVR